MTDKIHRHEKLVAVEDLGIAMKWQCECGWWTCAKRQVGEQVGDVFEVNQKEPPVQEFSGTQIPEFYLQIREMPKPLD
jgi:hypothetical protein